MCDIASPSITYNTISGNSSDEGGGISYRNGSSPFIEHNYIVGNHSGCGGGIYASRSRSIVKCNIIAENSATGGGGGITSRTDTSSIINNTLYNNSGADEAKAGGICCWSNAVPEIKQNIIVSSSFGYGIGCSPGSNPVISYNDVWDNYSGNFYGCPAGVGDTSWGETCYYDTPCDSFYNIIQDPLFDPDSTNYFLLCNSPCIDAGDPSDTLLPDSGCFIDMGAVEYPYVCGDANGDDLVNIADVVYKVTYLFQNGPAPCPMGRGDDNCDHEVDIADVVYEVTYLFGDGPPPCCGNKEPSLANPPSRLYHFSGFAEISLSEPKFTKDGVGEIIVFGKFDVELAAIQLEIKYDPEKISLSEPALTPRTEGLTIYSSSNKGIQKIDSLRSLQVGIVDLSGEHYISAGTGALVNLRMKGSDLSSLEITKAIFVDRDAQKIPVRITSGIEKAELLAKSEQATLPKTYSLFQNYPNPFNPETQISYDLPNDSWVKLSIYNIRGQKVRTLVDGFEAAGHKRIKWDGTDEEGKKVGSGLYFYRIQAGEFTDTKKMILMK